MTDVLTNNDRFDTAAANSSNDPDERPIPITRRRLDRVLVWSGGVLTVVLIVAGALLWWGNDFAGDYVHDELAAQNISFPAAESLEAQGRADLVGFAGQQVTTGTQAEAYASYIGGHVAAIADGATYSELSGPERAANAAVSEALANGAPADQIAQLEADAATISGQRDSIFRGEMLRGALLNTFAWSTLGRVAGIAAMVAFASAALMAVFVGFGVARMRSHHLA